MSSITAPNSASIGDSVVLPPDRGSIMGQIQRSQVQPLSLRCRFEMTAADAPLGTSFAYLNFPGARGAQRRSTPSALLDARKTP
jgi:hypothetical protein